MVSFYCVSWTNGPVSTSKKESVAGDTVADVLDWEMDPEEGMVGSSKLVLLCFIVTHSTNQVLFTKSGLVSLSLSLSLSFTGPCKIIPALDKLGFYRNPYIIACHQPISADRPAVQTLQIQEVITSYIPLRNFLITYILFLFLVISWQRLDLAT